VKSEVDYRSPPLYETLVGKVVALVNSKLLWDLHNANNSNVHDKFVVFSSLCGTCRTSNCLLAYSCGANRMEILDKGPLGSRMASEGCQYPITDLCHATTAQNVVDHLL